MSMIDEIRKQSAQMQKIGSEYSGLTVSQIALLLDYHDAAEAWAKHDGHTRDCVCVVCEDFQAARKKLGDV